jgi:hypothetical protein
MLRRMITDARAGSAKLGDSRLFPVFSSAYSAQFGYDRIQPMNI